MTTGIPVRLSGALAARARAAAVTQERSVTEQVEHWARLGQAVEDAIMAATVQRLKARSHDAELDQRLALATTTDGRAKAALLIEERNPIRHGIESDGSIRVLRSKKRSKKR
jgi:hypothetical protein